jgi:2-hydroxychromene-2-carboxylate isomerase
MLKTVEFYFDVGSPAAYLAFTQLPAIAARHQAQIEWRPVLLGGIFKAVGNRPPIEVAPKGRYFLEDMLRYAARYGVEMRINPSFPFSTVSLMRSAVAMQMYEPARLPDYAAFLYHAMWAEGLNLGDPATFAQALTSNGYNAAEIAAWIGDPAVKQKLFDCTNAAVERGLFGVPTMFVEGTMFFGQDRLDFVNEALAAA